MDRQRAPSQHRQKETDLLSFPSILYGGAKRSLWMFSIKSAWASLKAVISGLLFLNSRCLPKATESGRRVPTDWVATRSAVRC